MLTSKAHTRKEKKKMKKSKKTKNYLKIFINATTTLSLTTLDLSDEMVLSASEGDSKVIMQREQPLSERILTGVACSKSGLLGQPHFYLFNQLLFIINNIYTMREVTQFSLILGFHY